MITTPNFICTPLQGHSLNTIIFIKNPPNYVSIGTCFPIYDQGEISNTDYAKSYLTCILSVVLKIIFKLFTAIPPNSYASLNPKAQRYINLNKGILVSLTGNLCGYPKAPLCTIIVFLPYYITLVYLYRILTFLCTFI